VYGNITFTTETYFYYDDWSKAWRGLTAHQHKIGYLVPSKAWRLHYVSRYCL